MGIVGVDGYQVGEAIPGIGAVVELEGAQDRGEARRDEQILLLEAQYAPVLARVVGVQDLRDGLGVGAELVGPGIVSRVERIEVEVGSGGLGTPEPQAVDGLAAVADDRDVVGDGGDELPALGGEGEGSVRILVAHDIAPEAHEHAALGVRGLPRIAFLEPVVGHLDLPAVDDLLAEQPVAVAHAVAEPEDALARHGVEEAGGEAPQTPVAKAGVDLFAEQLVEGDAHLGEALLDKVAHAVVQKVVIEERTDEELKGEVVDLLPVAAAVLGVALGELPVGARGDQLGERAVLLGAMRGGDVLSHLGHDHGPVGLLELVGRLE